IADPFAKAEATMALGRRWGESTMELYVHAVLDPVRQPGRPARPQLVSARQLAQRGLGSVEGRAAFLHAIAHIEFNAINLAAVAIGGLAGMPAGYSRDWRGVAADETRHFGMLVKRLAQLGYAYGDFVAHNGLWDMAEKTAHSCLAR